MIWSCVEYETKQIKVDQKYCLFLEKAKKNGQYADISAFIDTARLEEEQYDILTGPKVRRKIREQGTENNDGE